MPRNNLIFIKRLLRLSTQLFILIFVDFGLLLLGSNVVELKSFVYSKQIRADLSVPEKFVSFTLSSEAIPLEKKYQEMGGAYYNPKVNGDLAIVEKVLSEHGLDEDAKFVQIMFYVGLHESWWNSSSVAGTPIVHCSPAGGGRAYGSVLSCRSGDTWLKKEYPTGIFQFLPSTFRTVSSGDIYNTEEQIRAFVIMVERGRADEFETIFRCTFEKCLTPELKLYALRFPTMRMK